MARTGEADEALAVDVQEITGTRPLVQPRLLPQLPRWPRDPRAVQRPPDSRVRVPGLASDQPRSPARAAPSGADPRLLSRREKTRRAKRPRRAIRQTRQRPPLLKRGLRPAPPPLARGRRRDTAASRRSTTRQTHLDIGNKCPPTTESETSVTVKPHPG